MNYLYDNPNKEEDVLFKELESEYNESAKDLKQFVDNNVKVVIAYESGESLNKVSLKAKDIKKSIGKFFGKNVKDKDALKIDTDKADVEIINLRSISKGELTYNTHKYNYIIKTEHTANLQEVEIFQVKINEINIDFE